MIEIDGSYGEGGGQVLRTSLALAAITGRPVRLERIRAGRRKPGLQPQHLTAVRALARICQAEVVGDRLDSQELTLTPTSAPQAGRYTFDVALAAKGGSAGAVSLIFQAVLVPLVLAQGTSELTLVGGTHVSWSPPFDYLKRVYLPILARAGLVAKVHLQKWGWYPVGGGIVKARIEGRGSEYAARQAAPGADDEKQVRPEVGGGLDLRERGQVLRVRGLAASSGLPKHIREREAGTLLQVLRSDGLNPRVDTVEGESKGTGTAVFVWVEAANTLAGFTALGERGKPAERVAEDAAQELLAYLAGPGGIDRHLADQLVLPLSLAAGPSAWTTQAVTLHLLTVAWVVNQFFPGRVAIEGEEGQPGTCRIL